MGGARDEETGHEVEGSQKSGDPPAQTCGQRVKAALRSNLLVLLLIVALLLGIVLGVLMRLRPEPYTGRELMYIRFPGEILMNMLKLLILPLIVSSLVSGMTSLDTRASGKLGLRAVVYYLTTTLMAVILGIILVVSIEPGKRGDKPEGGSDFRDVEPVDTFLDLIRQMFPDNIVEACFRKSLTTLKVEDEDTSSSDDAVPDNTTTTTTTNTTITTTVDTTTSSIMNSTLADMMNTTLADMMNTTNADMMNTTLAPSEPKKVPVLENVDGINMLGLVVFSIAMGIAINHVGDKGLPLKHVFDSLSEVTLVLVSVVIWYSPIGVLFLVTEEVVSMENPQETFEQLSFYFITVMAGLAVHGFVTLPLIYFLVCRRNPFRFMYGVLQALVTALGTSSSSATLPVTMRNLEENNGVDPRVIGFVAPVGATINMDGTALYEAVAVIFIGQVEGFELDIGNIIIICVTSTAAAIGAAGVPQAGLVTMVIVLTAVGFPSDRVGLILAIDWLLDRFRTSVNVLGDAYGAGIVNHLSKADLRSMDQEDLESSSAATSSSDAGNGKTALASGNPDFGSKAGKSDVPMDKFPTNSNGDTGHVNASFNERL
ncbi:excitatory amino acid transporter 3-like [Babylonia areolata]|uniref:excitatory amino acid transporter 3-like n=1 Tax=Babylonia areolata TaxID=304850 RepID=UPI003FCEEF6E